jgi:hypothetical protein
MPAVDHKPSRPPLRGLHHPAPSTLERDKLDSLAKQINTIYREATLDVTFAIGQLVIEEIYGGSITLWGEQGTRSISYRKLASRGDLLLSPSTLCRAVAIYVLCERLGGRHGWRHLTASHLQEVLSLDPPHQERLLRAADEESWSVSRLRAEVTRHRPKVSRSVPTRLIQKVRRLKTFLVKQPITPEEAHAARDLNDDQIDELVEVVGDLKQRLATLEQLLAARKNR